MRINMKALAQDERDEWQQLVSDALNGDRQATDAAVSRALIALEQSERAGREWPAEIKRQAVRAALKDELKARAKAENSVLVDYRGQLISKDRRRGVRVTDIDGRRGFQQKLIDEMSWEEFESWAAMNDDQIEGLLTNREMAMNLKRLHERYPETETVAQALVLDGITLDDLLAGAA